MPTPTEELAALARKSIDDVKELASKVTEAVDKLDRIRGDYTSSRWKVIGSILRYLAPFVGIAFLIYCLQFVPCGKEVEFGALKIVADSCPKR